MQCSDFLPPAFIRSMAQLLEGELEPFLLSYSQPARRGIRFRPGMEGTCADTRGRVPWFDGGWYLDPDSAAGAVPFHDAGAYYLPEPSAMAPAALLAPEPGERILDLCAAPGGKSTQIGQMLRGRGVLVADEPYPDRAAILSGNLERMGIINSVTVSEKPERLAEAWPGWFDRVLVDAPCSGEGMFRRHPESVGEWNENLPDMCAERQAAILDSAATLLRPGGVLVYSTCTFNRTENEGTVARFLKAHPEFVPGEGTLPGAERREDGMFRFWPHKTDGEGHFAALLQKEEDGRKRRRSVPYGPKVSGPQEAEIAAFLKDRIRTRLSGETALFRNRVVLLPEELPDLGRITVLRLGLHLGTMKGRTFAPDHALALACESTKRLEVNEEQAAEWMTGQPLPCGGEVRGWLTPVLRGVQLGWGKASEGTVKNHYPKGLRRRLRTAGE